MASTGPCGSAAAVAAHGAHDGTSRSRNAETAAFSVLNEKLFKDSRSSLWQMEARSHDEDHASLVLHVFRLLLLLSGCLDVLGAPAAVAPHSASTACSPIIALYRNGRTSDRGRLKVVLVLVLFVIYAVNLPERPHSSAQPRLRPATAATRRTAKPSPAPVRRR